MMSQQQNLRANLAIVRSSRVEASPPLEPALLILYVGLSHHSFSPEIISTTLPKLTFDSRRSCAARTSSIA
jgi:hypothetical protein